MVLVPQAVFVFIHPHPPPAPAPSRAQVWAAIPAWVSVLDVYCRLESRKHWEGWSKTLDHILKKKNCVHFAKPHCMFFQQQVCHPRDITFRLMLQVNSEHYPTNGAISQAKFSHIWPHHLIKLVAGDWKRGVG